GGRTQQSRTLTGHSVLGSTRSPESKPQNREPAHAGRRTGQKPSGRAPTVSRSDAIFPLTTEGARAYRLAGAPRGRPKGQLERESSSESPEDMSLGCRPL